MLDATERTAVFQNAYVPEHLPEYGEAVSGGEGFLHEGYICYVAGQHVLLIGYPLKTDARRPEEILPGLIERFKTKTLAVVSEEVEDIPGLQTDARSVDWYYRLSVDSARIHPDNAYMIRRAARDLRIEQGVFGREHEMLVQKFCSERRVGGAHLEIFRHIPDYVRASKTAHLIDARRGDRLAAFNVIEEGSSAYLFYMFHFRDRSLSIPGASDLLFWEMKKTARNHGKKWLNLGLGINSGVRRFKENWGGAPFLKHTVGTMAARPGGPFKALLDSILRGGGAL